MFSNENQQQTTQNNKMCRPTKQIRRSRSGNRTGSEVQFPGKLHDMMAFVEREGLESIISWVRNGRALMVHNPEKLVELLPLFFSQTKYRSFQRQLNMWHFERVLDGPDRGAFVHPLFIRGNKPLCAYMSRHGLHLPLPQHLTQLQSNMPLTSNISNNDVPIKRVSLESTISDFTPSKSDILTSDSALHCIPDLKDGDLSIFEGRQFYFVDSVITDSDAQCESEEDNENRIYDIESVFRDLQERKRCLIEQTRQSPVDQSTFYSSEQLPHDLTIFSLQ